MVQTPKSQEIGIKFTVTDCSNFDERCSGAHFVSFLFYYYCIIDPTDYLSCKHVYSGLPDSLKAQTLAAKMFGLADRFTK